jgi:hypothetical protein
MILTKASLQMLFFLQRLTRLARKTMVEIPPLLVDRLCKIFFVLHLSTMVARLAVYFSCDSRARGASATYYMENRETTNFTHASKDTMEIANIDGNTTNCNTSR